MVKMGAEQHCLYAIIDLSKLIFSVRISDEVEQIRQRISWRLIEKYDLFDATFLFDGME